MKRFFSTALCVILALALAAFGLCYGARRGWQHEYEQLQGLYAQENGLGSMLSLRSADASNLRVVALRHLPADHPLVAALTAQRDALNQPGAALAQLQAADQALTQAAHDLAQALLTLDSVKSSPRDQSYIDSILRELDQLAASGADQRYQAAAQDYNQRLGSTFSGRIAQVLGVQAAQVYP